MIKKPLAGVFSLVIIALSAALAFYAGAKVKFNQPAIKASESLDEPARRMVVPGGVPFGIKMHTRGVLVVGMSDIQKGARNVNPAKEAGLKIGDIVTKLNDVTVNRNDDVKRAVAACDGNEIKISATRGGEELELYLLPVTSDYDKGYKAGIWVRDSSAGIGTMTYYNPETLAFAGLGHAICDVDTGELMPLFSGEIVDVNISGANVGLAGHPGELKGEFLTDAPMGRLFLNSDSGIFGVLHGIPFEQEPVPLATREETAAGPAEILVTVSGNKPRRFAVEIERVNHGDPVGTKNMVLSITDPELLELCGGIVQGMSGSPILQNGRLIGAVTHVFVNDPTRGYGIFAENMENMLNFVENTEKPA